MLLKSLPRGEGMAEEEEAIMANAMVMIVEVFMIMLWWNIPGSYQFGISDQVYSTEKY